MVKSFVAVAFCSFLFTTLPVKVQKQENTVYDEYVATDVSRTGIRFLSDTLKYTVDFSEADVHLFNVTLTVKSSYTGVMDFKIPQWTPGYYQLLHFSENVKDVRVFNQESELQSVVKTDENTWRTPVHKGKIMTMKYKVLADKNFIARPYINRDWAFIRPTGVFLYPSGLDSVVATVAIKDPKSGMVVSGLKKVDDYFVAESIDQLFDSPLLAGDVKEVGRFEVKGIPHYFFARDLELVPANNLISDMKKMVESAVGLMGDIPYNDYTFMSMGKGNGGIEQLNSSVVTLNSSDLKDAAGRKRILNFLTHEYFHNFNIKRIRPIELGPFDYSKENRTNMLWVGEGLTVYFEDIILNRAGIITGSEMVQDWEQMIRGYENNPGKAFQTLAQSSYQTWEDGPFGVRGKTISYYEKGPIVGMLLDLKIRTSTSNKKSLIDVMRYLYQTYYKKLNRGFTEQEFKDVCEEMAGASLDDIFDYVYTLKEIDYNKYLEPAGLYLQHSGQTEWEKVEIKFSENPTPVQKEIRKDLFRDK